MAYGDHLSQNGRLRYRIRFTGGFTLENLQAFASDAVMQTPKHKKASGGDLNMANVATASQTFMDDCAADPRILGVYKIYDQRQSPETQAEYEEYNRNQSLRVRHSVVQPWK